MTDLENVDDKLHFMYRGKAYVSLGYGSWVGFLIAIAVFVMVLYDYGMKYIPVISAVFLNNPLGFLMIAFPAVIVFCGLVGHWAYYGGAFAARAKIEWQRNPEYMEMKQDLKDSKALATKALEGIAELKEILSKLGDVSEYC